MVKYKGVMSNSFYYFFSATPQVLAAILALFGVFVIFKIQSLKTELISLGKSLISDVGNYNDQSDGILSIQIKVHAVRALQNNDINGLKSTFDIFSNKANYFYKEFYKLYDSLKTLINSTIFWSIFTSLIIISCLIILSQGNYFLCHHELLSVIIWIIIALIVSSFSGLIYILVKSLKES